VATYKVIFGNGTGQDLFVTGRFGLDFTNFELGQKIGTGTCEIIADWDSGTASENNWDFIYLGKEKPTDENDGKAKSLYQLYMQRTNIGKFYQYDGYYYDKPGPTKEANPYPFPSDKCTLWVRGEDDEHGLVLIYSFLTDLGAHVG